MPRHRKSLELHDLQGTVPQYVTGQSSVPAALPRPPKFLTPEARKKFKALVRQLSARRAVTAGDEDLLTLYCTTWERWRSAMDKVREEGDVVEYTRLSSDGSPVKTEKPNLRLAMMEKAERTMLAILTRLGLTPKDRDAVRPTAPRPPKPSKLSAVEQIQARMAALQREQELQEPEEHAPETEEKHEEEI